ncbi:MAG: hypothetical protein JO107_04670, partial [Hyphomicrobiales bacterium]|nr:hypothetical protein [Hyphomicrobiales bacterium]
MMRICLLALTALVIGCASARAQLTLPGAPGGGESSAPGAPKTDSGDKGGKTDKAKEFGLASSPHAVADKPLRLNGSQGQFLLSDRDKVLRIEKLSLAGEVISEPSRKCLIDIVGDAPIETKSLGKPDGLARFEAEIPACTFSFDLLDGAVLAPPQDRACVFAAADCQATPAGLWGPDPSTLHSDAKTIGRQRLRADNAADRTLHAIQAKLKDQPDADAIRREDGDIAARR